MSASANRGTHKGDMTKHRRLGKRFIGAFKKRHFNKDAWKENVQRDTRVNALQNQNVTDWGDSSKAKSSLNKLKKIDKNR